MTNETETKQPTPVRNAFLILAAVNTVMVATFPVLQLFNVITWTADQMAGVVGLLGVIVNTLGSTIASIYSENRVTPVVSPRDDNLSPLVPITNDGLED